MAAARKLASFPAMAEFAILILFEHLKAKADIMTSYAYPKTAQIAAARVFKVFDLVALL